MNYYRLKTRYCGTVTTQGPYDTLEDAIDASILSLEYAETYDHEILDVNGVVVLSGVEIGEYMDTHPDYPWVD